jgi:hypothetical protein
MGRLHNNAPLGTFLLSVCTGNLLLVIGQLYIGAMFGYGDCAYDKMHGKKLVPTSHCLTLDK